MSLNKSSVFFSVALFLVGGHAFADGWGSAKVKTGASDSPVVIPSKANPALLRQKSQLISKQKQYQTLIQQVNQNIVRRPDLKAALLSQLKNYKMHKQRVDVQLAQVNQRLGGAKASSNPKPRINADNNAVVALAAQFGLKSKALVHFPELIKAKSKKEEKVIIKQKLSRTGYKPSTRDASAVIDDRMLFENGSAELLPAASQRVANLAALYHRYGSEINRIVVRGHTNSVGDRNYNLNLSRARSNKVKAGLMSLQVPASAIVSQGFGEDQLLPNINPASPMNRRVEYGVLKR